MADGKIRNPKSEIRNKSEIGKTKTNVQNPPPARLSRFLFWILNLFRISAFRFYFPPMVTPLEIGPLVIDPPLLQAPMAGFTNYAFRQVVRQHGGVGLPATEMFFARGFLEIDSRHGHPPERLWGVLDEPRPLAAQIWDNKPALHGGGRPAAGPRVSRQRGGHQLRLSGHGSYREGPQRVVFAALSGPRRPDRGGGGEGLRPTPVTAKIRLGVCRDTINACDVAQAVEDAGGAALRSTAARLPTCSAARPIGKRFRGSSPICPHSADRQRRHFHAPGIVEAFRRYDVDGVMIGRAALNRPWLFRQAQAALRGEPIPPDPTLAEQQR